MVVEATGDEDIEEEEEGVVAFKLSSDGETVILVDADGQLVDRIEYPELDEDQAYARTLDGGETWAVTDDMTRGAANGG